MQKDNYNIWTAFVNMHGAGNNLEITENTFISSFSYNQLNISSDRHTSHLVQQLLKIRAEVSRV